MSNGERANEITALINEIRESLTMLESILPRQVDSFVLSQESKLPWKVLLYREALIWRIVELGRSALESFLSERMVSGVVLTRAAVEASVALWCLFAKVDAIVDSKMVVDVDEYLMKLAMGTATGWPETDTFTDVLTMPRPIKILDGDRFPQVLREMNWEHRCEQWLHPLSAATIRSALLDRQPSFDPHDELAFRVSRSVEPWNCAIASQLRRSPS